MGQPLTVVLLTGVSGGGKTTALHALEDVGFYCVDNLPLPMLASFIDTMKRSPSITRVAMVVDARFHQYLMTEEAALPDCAALGSEALLYFDAADEVLLRRFSQTRRKHPLGGDDLPVLLARERKLLGPLRAQATQCIDTSDLTLHQLKRLMQERYGEATQRFVLSLVSFGYRYGIPSHADVVLDVRFLPNPFFVSELKALTGCQAPVSAYVLGQDDSQVFLGHMETLFNFLVPRYDAEGKAYVTVAIGCTGGRHRSVAVVEELGRRLGQRIPVRIRHRDVGRAPHEGDDA